MHCHSPGLPLHAPLHISSPAHGDTQRFHTAVSVKNDTSETGHVPVMFNMTRHKSCETARTRHSLALNFATARPPYTWTDITGRPRPTTFRSSNSPPAHGGHITCNLSDSVYSRTTQAGQSNKSLIQFSVKTKRQTGRAVPHPTLTPSQRNNMPSAHGAAHGQQLFNH